MFKKLIALSLLLSTFTWAAPSPETVLTGNCLSSYQKKYKTFKKHKAFVYAREEKTGKSRCQWQSGSSNPEAAKKSVIDACAKHQLNAECIIVETFKR